VLVWLGLNWRLRRHYSFISGNERSVHVSSNQPVERVVIADVRILGNLQEPEVGE
jgi:hypothetical protein